MRVSALVLLVPLVCGPVRALASLESGSAQQKAPLSESPEVKANLARCNSGDAKACNFMGALYATGIRDVFKIDEAQAFSYFLKSCNGGYATGCANLANAYYNGLGVAADRARAVQLYQRACDRGAVTACVDLGVIYRDGKGDQKKDQPRAAQLFQHACDIADASCASIASMYELGWGVPQDVARAKTLYQRSCHAAQSDAVEDIQKVWSRASCNKLSQLK